MHMESWMPLQPALHLDMFMRGVVVGDQVQLLVCGSAAVGKVRTVPQYPQWNGRP